MYHGEIVMLTSDGVNEFLAEGRIMQYLITYVENCEFERVEGILAMRMLDYYNDAGGARIGFSFNGNVDRDDGCGCCTISHSFWIVHIKQKKKAAQLY